MSAIHQAHCSYRDGDEPHSATIKSAALPGHFQHSPYTPTRGIRQNRGYFPVSPTRARIRPINRLTRLRFEEITRELYWLAPTAASRSWIASVRLVKASLMRLSLRPRFGASKTSTAFWNSSFRTRDPAATGDFAGAGSAAAPADDFCALSVSRFFGTSCSR